jgi:hypothetical protein
MLAHSLISDSALSFSSLAPEHEEFHFIHLKYTKRYIPCLFNKDDKSFFEGRIKEDFCYLFMQFSLYKKCRKGFVDCLDQII